MSASIFRKRPAWLKAKGQSSASPEAAPAPRSATDDAEHLDMFSRSAHTLTWEAEGQSRRSQIPASRAVVEKQQDADSARIKRRRLGHDQESDLALAPVLEKGTQSRPSEQSSLHQHSPAGSHGSPIAPASPPATNTQPRIRRQSFGDTELPPGGQADVVTLDADGHKASHKPHPSTTETNAEHAVVVSEESSHSGDEVDFDKLLKRAKMRRLQDSSGAQNRPASAHDVEISGVPTRPGAPSSAINPPGSAMRPSATGLDPVLKILVHSKIPNTAPIFGNVRLSQPLKILRVTWCKKQGFDDELTSSVFLTWRGLKIFDMTNCRSLGVSVDAEGDVSWKVKGRFGVTEGSPNLEMEAWTPELYENESLGRREAQSEATAKTHSQPSNSAESKAQVRIIVKAQGYEDFKLLVKPDTTFGKIINAFRKIRGLGTDREAFLMFDGERLDRSSVVGDTDITDLDEVDLYVK